MGQVHDACPGGTHPRMRRRLLSLTIYAASISAAFLQPEPAAAHALPFGISLSWPEAHSARPWVLTNRGLVLTDAASAQLRCNEAYGVNSSALPSFWAGASGLALVTQRGAF